MLLPMGMQAQSASHPPPPPLPPPPSCSTQPRSRGARRPVASARAAGRSRQVRPRLFQQSQRPTERWQQQRPSSAQSDITASTHPCRTAGTRRGRQDGDAAALYAIKKKEKKIREVVAVAWPGNKAQTHTSITTHSLSLTHTPRQT